MRVGDTHQAGTVTAARTAAAVPTAARQSQCIMFMIWLLLLGVVDAVIPFSYDRDIL
jgi:hypothetical protein